MRRGRTAGWRCGWVEDSTIVWHSGCLAAGTGTARGEAGGAAMPRLLQPLAHAQGQPRVPHPWDGASQPASPCLSFPHRSTLHPQARPREARAARRGVGAAPHH